MEMDQYNKHPLGKDFVQRQYTRAEVEQQAHWVIYKGGVYDVRQYLAYHPGGRQVISELAGKDITTQFGKYQ